MSKIDKLILNYASHISIPWREDAPSEQRVIFCVYNPTDELKLRAKYEAFELETKKSGHEWIEFDLSNTYAEWLSKEEFIDGYLEKPELLSTLYSDYLLYLSEQFDKFLEGKKADENFMVSLTGVASVYSFVKVKEVVDLFAPKVQGKLLIFFPGSFENNNYRLLDRYDGWNYHAIPITAE